MDCKKIMQECILLEKLLHNHNIANTRVMTLKILAMLMMSSCAEGIVSKAEGASSIIDSIFLRAGGKISRGDFAGINAIEEHIAGFAGLVKHNPAPALLGIIYERLLAERKTQGAFYTPDSIVNFILAETVSNAKIVENPWLKILDISCGCGFFLLAAYDVLWQKYCEARSELYSKYPDKDWSDTGIHKHILENNLWGIDINSEAVDITKAGLLMKSVPDKKMRLNIIQGDSLVEIGGMGLKHNTFDYVIGNPPYVSFGLRGKGKLDKSYKAFLQTAFEKTAEYKLSYYSMFLQQGIDMLKTGGALGYIVPDSFLLGRYYSKIRRYILGNTWIKGLAHISCPVFKNVIAGYLVICIMEKQQKPVKGNSLQTTTYKISGLAELNKPLPSCSYSQGYFTTMPHSRFRLFFSDEEKKLIEAIEAGSTALSRLASGHTGIRAKLTQKSLVSEQQNSDTYKKGLISGSQVSRYCIQYQGHWLNIDKNILYKGGWREDIVYQRKILVRQTADTLTAAIDDNCLYHLNNIHSFILKDSKISLDYLLLILNSRLLAFYYHIVSIEYGRSMAQTDIETLELLPIKLDDMINRQAGELVQGMQELIRRVNDGDKGALHKARVLDEYIDQLVFRIYALNDKEIAYINKYEAALKNKYKGLGRRRLS